MSRWIDIDAVIYEHWHDDGYDTFVYCTDLENAPSIDIVRCRECKWYKANGTYQWCGRLDSTARITAVDFCSYGEREGE